MLSALRKLFFWNYARNTWQWDALCVVILIFIFLTPKSWFEYGERNGKFLHQSPAASILLVCAEVVESAEDKGKLEQRLRELTGRTDLQVLNLRKLTDAEGKTKGYQVDIR
ncbi:MAG: hypothetical protein AABN95_06645 [Acidobacteriota bacterium]